MLDFCKIVEEGGRKRLAINPKKLSIHFIRVWRKNNKNDAAILFCETMESMFSVMSRIKQENDVLDHNEELRRATEMTVFVDPKDFNAQ